MMEISEMIQKIIRKQIDRLDPAALRNDCPPRQFGVKHAGENDEM